MTSSNPDSSGQPLFIVDRDWLRQGSKSRKSWTGNVRNRSLYGLAIQVTQYDVPGAAATRRKSQTKTKGKTKRGRREKQSEATDSESQGDPEPSHRQDPSLEVVQYHNTPPTSIVSSQNVATDGFVPSMPISAYMSWPENPALHPPISSGLPGLECIKGLECYLDYCTIFIPGPVSIADILRS